MMKRSKLFSGFRLAFRMLGFTAQPTCLFYILTSLLTFSPLSFSKSIVNVYVWGGEIPQSVIQQFENTTGIQVNFSTYDSNETMYAKLKANQQGIYDVILPSSYFVERMRQQNMLMPLDSNLLTNLSNLDPWFANNDYDPNNTHSVPLVWGATGIFYNQNHVETPPLSWRQLWSPNYRKSLLLLDDAREVFAMALLYLGYSPNDVNPQHIEAAYNALLSLIPNIKLFSTEGIQALLIDEDVATGMVWNGDAFKANIENSAIRFVYPKEGYVVWIDCLAIPANAPHIREAYAFIQFLLQPNIAVQLGMTQGHAITNLKAQRLLPKALQEDMTIYPPKEVLSHGFIQRYPGEFIVNLYNMYWQQLKMAF